MSTELAQQPKQQNPAVVFRQRTTNIAATLLRDWVGDARAQEAVGRISIAISAAAASSKKPEEFYSCTAQSVGSVIAISALTGIMVSTGATSLAYAIPRRPRKGEPPQLTYQLSHRGINALAGRANRTMIAVPIGSNDKIKVTESGDVIIEERDFDNPPTEEDEFRGIMLIVKDTATGTEITRQWVAKKIIDKRRATSDSYKFAEQKGNEWAKESSPWHKWYVEQAIKTAMHYAIGRGWCVIDDTEAQRALEADVSSDFAPITIDATPSVSRTESLEQRLLGESTAETPDFAVEIEQSNQQAETVAATTKSTSKKKPKQAELVSDDNEPLYREILSNSTTAEQLTALRASVLEDKSLPDLTRDELLTDIRLKIDSL